MPDDQELLELAASLRDDAQPTKADQVRGQLKAAETYNPDAYAKAMKAGAKKGVKPQVVLQDPKAFEDRPDMEEFTVLSPKTADWILENFDNAVLGGQDIKGLGRIESAAQRAKRLESERITRANVGKAGRWTSPLYSLGAGLSTLLKVPSDIAYWGTSMAARIAGQQAPSRERFEGALLYTPLAGLAVGSKATGLSKEWYEQRERETPRFVVTDPKTGESFFNPKAISLDQAAQVLARELPSMAAMVGLEVATVGTATPVVAANVLQKLGKAGKVLKYALRPSAGVEVARTIQGIHQEGIETLLAKGQTEEQAAANAAPGAALAGIASFTMGAPLQAKALEGYFTRIATLKGGATLAAKGKTILKGIASQGFKEGTQETVQGFGEDLAKWASFHPDLSVREASENAVANFFGGFAMGGLMGGVGSAPASIRQAQQREFFQALADGAKDSKLLKRLPKKFQEAVQASVQDGPVEHVRISPEAYTTYFQSKNIDPVQMAETLGIQNFEEASVSGTDLLIPTGAYAAHLAASEHHAELSQDMRLGEDMMTPREAAAAEATKGQVEEVGQAVSLEVDEATQAGTEFQAIQEDLKGRYIQAGETPAVADTYALDMAKVFYTLAQREGLKPQELMAQYAPKIVRGQAPMPEQVVTEMFTPETFPEEGVQWWEKDDLWFQGAYGEKPQKVETAPGVVQAPFRQTEFQGQLEDYQKTGQWYYNERRMVPLVAIEEKAPWDEGRRADAETRLKDTAATTPVLLATEDGGKTFKIQDGIHRIAAAKAQGFTAIPAEVQVVVSDRAPVEGDFAGKDLLGGEVVFGVDEATGLPLNEDGTVTVYHHTSKANAEKIRKTKKLKSTAEPDVYFTTEPNAEATGYGDASVAIRIEPDRLELDDEFPDGRKDFRVNTGRPGGSIQVTLEPEGKEPQFKGVDVESPEFKAWFGDSKVVDSAGKPLKVYHGTSAEFEQFNLGYFGLNDKGYLGDGFYFGSQTVASAYGTKGDGGRVIPAYLSLKKPFEITPENWKEQLGRIRALKEEGKSVREELTKDGFDGVIDRSNGKISEIVAFDPTQIKSAISNTGAFSQTDPRILYQAGLPLFQSQKDDFSFGSKKWNEFYRSQVGSRARAKGDQSARAKKGLASAATKRGQAEFDAEREAALRAEEEAFMRFDRAVEQIAKPRGWFTRAADGSFIIGKTPQGDFSTFIHEPAHAYLEMFKDLATREGASQRIQDDGAKIMAFLGVESWDQIGTTEHEKWARANEAYCREGKAPSDTLRGVFERFRVWLTMVYRQVATLDVELNDDIRGVFDRMRATDEEIELAHADIAGPRLFRTAEEAGMTEKDFQRYAREKDLEVEQAKGEILAKLNAAAVREKTKEWKEEASNVRAAIEQWVDAQPNFRAVAVLRAGKLEDGTPFTLKKDALVEQFGEDRTKALLKAHPGIYRLEGELDAETAAEILGFESGEALMTALEETPKRGEVIKSEVRRVMTERHGDIRFDGTLEDQALQAVANDQRAKGLHKELESLKRKLENAPAQAKIQSLKDQIAKLEAEAKAQVKEKDEDAAFLAKQANALAETNEQLRARLEARDAKIQALKDQLAQAEAERKQETREDRAEAKTARAMVPPMQAFREEAKRLIDAKQIKNLNPNAYLNAQRKYSREAHVQALKGAYFESAEAKQKELLNHFLYLEATKAKDESEKAYKYVHRLMKPAAMEAIAKSGGEGGQRVYWDQIQNILNEYQFVRVPSRNLRDIALFAKENEENGIVFDPATLPGAKNYRELTLPELQAVVDALKNIEHVARAEGKVLQKMKEIDLKVEVKDAKDAAYKHHTGKLKPIPAAGEALTLKEKLPRSIGGWRAYLGKMEWWIDKLDGGDINGPWRRNLMTPIREAGGDVETAAHRINGELKKLYATMPKSFNEDLDKETPVQFPGRERRLTRRQLRTWALNLGTEENRNVALLGEGLMDGMGILSPEYDKALKELTSDEWRFIQGVWDIFETLRPEVEAQALRTTGIAPKWKKSTPFKVKAKDGPEIQIRGGYYPLKADPYRSQVGERQEDVDLPKVGISRPTTSTSHLQKVTGATYRLNLDYVQGVTKHINDVLLNTYAGEAIRDVYKFIRQPEIKQALQETMGHEYYQEMLPWLQDFANSNRIAAMEDKMVLQPLMRFKSAMVVSKLGFNLLSHVVQVTDPIKAAIDPDMKVSYLMKGYAALAADPAKYQEIRDLSPGLMRYRAENWNRDLKEMLDYPGPFKGKMEAFRQFSMQGFAVMDKLATSGAWWGRYQQGLDTHGDQAQAILEADRLVARDFQAGAPENMARVMRSKGWMNLLTTFGGDANTWFGILDASIRSGSPKRLGVVLMALLAEQMLSQLIRNRAPEDDEEAEWLLEQMGQSVFNKLPIIGDFLEAVIQQIQGKRADLSNPVLQGAEKVLAAPYRTIDAYQNQDDAEKAAMESIESLGTVFGVPGTAQGLKSWRYVRQVERGERSEPENALEATRNVTLGPPPKGRQ